MDDHLTSALFDALSEYSETVAFCESITAGLASATLANISGSSKILRGGLITYATDLKETLAGVPARTIQNYGVISRQCAEAMAEGVRKVCSADWGCGITGVAGPDQQDVHNVGEVWIGIAGKNGCHAVAAFTQEQRQLLAGQGRNVIRQEVVQRSFELLVAELVRD